MDVSGHQNEFIELFRPLFPSQHVSRVSRLIFWAKERETEKRRIGRIAECEK